MITVFTPTYNRAELLARCYQSLLKQTDKTFKWLIVDDGSNDNTEELARKWKEQGKIDITYIKQKNGGKHVAHNTGVLACQTELFICLDSDDFLSEDAIHYIRLHEQEVLEDKQLGGIAFLKGDELGKLMGSHMPNNVRQASIKALYEQQHFKGELALVFKTDVLKQYLFPVFEGEKFVGESVVYDQISKGYDMLLEDHVIYLCEYRIDGYTTNVTKLYAKNPRGYIYFLNQNIQLAEGIKEKIMATSLYTAGCWRIRYRKWFTESKWKRLIILVIPLAVIKYIKVEIKTRLFTLKIKCSK